MKILTLYSKTLVVPFKWGIFENSRLRLHRRCTQSHSSNWPSEYGNAAATHGFSTQVEGKMILCFQLSSGRRTFFVALEVGYIWCGFSLLNEAIKSDSSQYLWGFSNLNSVPPGTLIIYPPKKPIGNRKCFLHEPLFETHEYLYSQQRDRIFVE